MNPKKYSIDEVACATSSGDCTMYNITDRDGTVYATTYDMTVAKIIRDALEKKFI